jgi:hypothetical protein
MKLLTISIKAAHGNPKHEVCSTIDDALYMLLVLLSAEVGLKVENREGELVVHLDPNPKPGRKD